MNIIFSNPLWYHYVCNMNHELNPWKVRESKVIYDNPWITLIEDQVINPAGNPGIYGKVQFKNRAVGIIPMDHHQNIWLVGQFRYALNEYSWEIPMGGVPHKESLLEGAQRELKEETGLEATQWTEILKLHTSNCVTDEIGFVYLAEDLTQGSPEFDETEALEIRKLPFTEAIELVIDGAITDAISIAGILKLAAQLKA